ncbi:hypothetical protein CMI37_27765 [Candidatus Pacearchaeota archaeon]|nr:hypothetical protein [Candidatus Pacearchaeota archaeon]
MKATELMQYINKTGLYTSSIGLQFPVVIVDAKPTPYNSGSVSVRIKPAQSAGSGLAWVLLNSINLNK